MKTLSNQPTYEQWVAFVGGTIRKMRDDRKMTQRELATASGLPLSCIQQVESGKHSPSELMRHKIANALGIDVQQLEWRGVRSGPLRCCGRATSFPVSPLKRRSK